MNFIDKILAKRQIEERLHLLTHHQKAINDLVIAIGETMDLKKIYRVIFSKLQEIMTAATMVISFYDKEEQLLTAGYVITDSAELDVSKFPPIPLNKEKGKGTQSQVIYTGEIYYSDDLQRDLETSKTKYTYTREGEVYEGDPKQSTKEEDISKSAVYVPMKISGEIIGVLGIQNFQANAFKKIDLALLTIFANVASIGIENAKLKQSLK